MPNPLLISIILCSIMLSACGKKGPLYLPDEPKKQAMNTSKVSSINMPQQALRLATIQTRLQQDKS
ncbi:lipoprotein [Thiomicrorhabdus sp. Milos-T2]|uniref:LPS translocon maturation chaperone LptM n=1 Tax=Thiomicrorhabdus sp. Milos-T2 TaxID=90814 RepID=UPI000493DBD4|nr:lipoprotein [Thiomicrorhabdus sp. Milos-T2]